MEKYINSLKGFKHYIPLLYELVLRDIKVRYKRSVLGLLWTIVNPILTMFIMTLIFSRLFRFEIENYTVYFLIGNILFSFFTESTTNGLHSVLDNSNLIKKIYIPKYLFPISKVLSSVVNLFFSFWALILVMIFTKVTFKITLLLVPVILLCIIIFSFGISLILSTIMVFFRDIAQIYSIITLLWMYLTLIFYPVELLKENAPWALKINPMYHYISYFRCLVLDGDVPGIKENIICLSFTFFVFVLGLVIFYKKQDKFILYI